MDKHPHNRRHDGLAVAALAVLACAFWGNCLWGGKVPVAAVYQKQMLPWAAATSAGAETRQWDALIWDGMAQFYPWRLLLHRGGQSGELPLWNPYQFCGTPFAGNGQSALFYPPNWLYLVVHPNVGMGLSAALHFFLAGLFAFGLARAWKLAVLPSLFAALAFSYGGFMVTLIELPTLPNTLIWLPLAWWGVEVIVRRHAGLPSLEPPGSSVVPLSGAECGGAREKGRNEDAVAARRGLLMLAAALGMSLLAGHLQIAAYVWVFTFVYAFVRLASGSAGFQPAPHVAGSAPGGLEAGTSRRWRGASQIIVACAIGLLLGLPQLLPTLELGRASSRGAGGPTAEGFAAHRQRALHPLELTNLLTPDFLGSPVSGDYPETLTLLGATYGEHCGFVGAVTLLLGLAGLCLKPRRTTAWLFAGLALFALWGAMGGPPAALLYWGVPKLGLAGGFSRLLSVWTLAAALWGAAGLQALSESVGGDGAVVGRRLVPRRSLAVSGLALLFLGAQLLPWAYRFNPRSSAQDVYPETELIRQLRTRLGSDRYVALNDRRAWGLTDVPTNVILPPNAATVYGLRCVDGYDSLFPASYRGVVARREHGDPSPPANGNMLLLGNDHEWATTYRVASRDVWPPGVPALWEGEGVKLSAPLPGAPRARLWSTSDALSSVLRPPAAVAIVADGLNSVKLDLSAAWARRPVRPGEQVQLLLEDTYYPGWRATVDGQPRQIEPMDAFRSVVVTPGTRAVEMVYFPASVAVGLFLGLLALSALAVVCTFGRGGRGR